VEPCHFFGAIILLAVLRKRILLELVQHVDGDTFG
jgi:hypothetical protein